MRLIDGAFKAAQKELGVHETGDNNPRILEYLRSCDLDESDQETEGTSWCSAFVNWCIQQSGGKGTRNAMARSFQSWGRKLDKPEKGCIVVLWRGSPLAETGHVGFFYGYSNGDTSKLILLGGNQDDRVCFKEYPTSRVVAYRTSKD